MNIHSIMAVIGGGAALAGLCWFFFNLWREADHRADAYKKALEEMNLEVKKLKRQAEIYAEEKRKNEQKLNEAASHSRPGFNASIELMQELGNGRAGRND